MARLKLREVLLTPPGASEEGHRSPVSTAARRLPAVGFGQQPPGLPMPPSEAAPIAPSTPAPSPTPPNNPWLELARELVQGLGRSGPPSGA